MPISAVEWTSNTFIYEFESQLIGKTIGEHTIEAQFPENYSVESLAGQNATFKATIKEIKEKRSITIDQYLKNKD